MSRLNFVRLSLLVISSGLVSGCSETIVEPDLGIVKGTVTVDGQPGADLMVQFEPKPSGSGKATEVGAVSIGTTDPGGNYELMYKSEKGAVVGSHVVRITSAAGGGPAGGETGAVAINIPPMYNTESSIVKDVAKGENKIDIEIKTK
ncbi:MAG: hypothetical protein U0936_18640 [Planctomycetaceae bacterium]